MGKLQIVWREGPTVSVIAIAGVLCFGDEFEKASIQLSDSLSRGRLVYIVHINNRWLNSTGLGLVYKWNSEILKAGGTLVVSGIRKRPIVELPFKVVPNLYEAGIDLGIPETTFEKELGWSGPRFGPISIRALVTALVVLSSLLVVAIVVLAAIFFVKMWLA